MRIAVVHSFYSASQPSGENAVVDEQVAALTSAGHEVMLVSRSTPLAPELGHSIRSAVTVATGRGPSPMNQLREYQPDVVHVHNLFPNFGRTWASNIEFPIVATLHNYRPICPAGTLFRSGHICTTCVDRNDAWPSVKFGCYKGGRLSTIPLALSTKFARDPLLESASLVTTLSETMSELYAKAGVPRQRLRLVQNFSKQEPADLQSETSRHFWLYAGRLSPEKGIAALVERWPIDKQLLIVGTGPDESRIVATKNPSVTMLGHATHVQVGALMQRAIGLVFPSQWLEGFALVCIEALASGTPILAWHPAPAADDVEALGVGLVAPADLHSAIEMAAEIFPKLRLHCQDVFRTRFSESAWVTRQCSVYAEAIALSGS